MSEFDLKLVKDRREQILLAEAAGLLHDWEKCFIGTPQTQVTTPREFEELLRGLPSPDDSGTADFVTLCDRGSHPKTPETINHQSQHVRLLAHAHDIAHIDKEENVSKSDRSDELSSAFGHENFPASNLLSDLIAGTRDYLSDGGRTPLTNRSGFISTLRDVFVRGRGDDRRPINEVTLWDWGYAVASLYKSELARHFLRGEWRQRNQLRWRMLRINFDVLELYAKAVKISDLLGYQEKIEAAYAAVKKLIEEDYPLGNEAYRDTTGIYFTYPDLHLPAELHDEIRRRVEGIEPELAPRIQVGESLGSRPEDSLKRLLAEEHEKAKGDLATPFTTDTLSPCWDALWGNLPEGNWEVCPVCRLRPMAEGEEVCQHCGNRRRSRVEAWKKKSDETIWMDEIADHHNRVALMVGKFGLEDWLSGDLVKTMLVKAAVDDPVKCVSKNPSPARLRRIWETCQGFWTETVEGILHGVADDILQLRRARMLVTPDKKGIWKGHVSYDGTINGFPISLLWQETEKRFVTIINLQLAGGESIEPQELARKWQGCEITVCDPDNTREPLRFHVEAASVATNDWEYLPCLTLLTSPDRFFVLVPASDAVEIAERIRQDYLKQFGKVQNRLPLFLGLVFFRRKTPLLAAMDTARRMLDQVQFGEEVWIIKEAADDGKIHFENDICFNIPTMMGDGKTEDLWYPYFLMDGEQEPGHAKLRFQLKLRKFGDRWLAHARCLRSGDRVKLMPSRFSYFFLEHTAKRFELSEEHVRYLDDLPRLIRMWEAVRGTPDMTDTKLRAVAGLLQSKRELWRNGTEELRNLAETTLKEANLWNPNKGQCAVSPDDVLCDRFAACLELYLYILKRRVKTEKAHEQQTAAV